MPLQFSTMIDFGPVTSTTNDCMALSIEGAAGLLATVKFVLAALLMPDAALDPNTDGTGAIAVRATQKRAIHTRRVEMGPP
jgi:hypothetical protein